MIWKEKYCFQYHWLRYGQNPNQVQQQQHKDEEQHTHCTHLQESITTLKGTAPAAVLPRRPEPVAPSKVPPHLRLYYTAQPAGRGEGKDGASQPFRHC